MGDKFPSRVKHTQSGESVTAGVASRAAQALEGRTNFLKNQLDAIESKSLLVHSDAACDPAVLEGQPVYWHDANLRYELALAAVETDTATGTLVPTASADCVGLVLKKKGNGATCDVAMLGLAFYGSLTNAIDDEITAGRYYLSSSTPGKLTKQRPPVTVAVAYVFGPLDACDENSWIFVSPQMRDFLEDHIHYCFDLFARPAGDHIAPEVNGCWTIDNADATLTGWLPADDAVFDGNAPTGAVFGYNLTTHTALSQVWPPIPLSAVGISFDKGDGIGGTEIQINGTNPLVKIDSNGIWWMSCCEGQQPWPEDFGSSNSSSISSSAGDVDCPRTESMHIKLCFAKMVFATEKTVVTSLQPADDQPLIYKNCEGEIATTGDLHSELDINALVTTTDEVGGSVLKKINDANLAFGAGNVTEGLINGSDRLEISGSIQRYSTPDDSATAVVHQGLVTINFLTDPLDRTLNPQITYLGDALERGQYKGVHYIGFPEDRDSAIRLRFNVPYDGLPVDPALIIRTWIFGRLSSTLPQMTVGYQRLIRPTDGVPTPIVAGDTALTYANSFAVTLDEVYEIDSSQFEIAAGDTILAELARAEDAAPTYAGEVGILRIEGVIVAGSSSSSSA